MFYAHDLVPQVVPLKFSDRNFMCTFSFIKFVTSPFTLSPIFFSLKTSKIMEILYIPNNIVLRECKLLYIPDKRVLREGKFLHIPNNIILTECKLLYFGQYNLNRM